MKTDTDFQDRCEATAERTGERCHRNGYFDPCEGQFRCSLHETRGILERPSSVA